MRASFVLFVWVFDLSLYIPLNCPIPHFTYLLPLFLTQSPGCNPFRGKWGPELKNHIEESHIELNHFFADLIRKSDTKPYAFITASSTMYYPPSSDFVYDESFSLPQKPQDEDRNRPELQAQELSLPYLSRLYRDSEFASRVFRPGTC